MSRNVLFKNHEDVEWIERGPEFSDDDEPSISTSPHGKDSPAHNGSDIPEQKEGERSPSNGDDDSDSQSEHNSFVGDSSDAQTSDDDNDDDVSV